MQYLCSGFDANVSICGACAAELCEYGGGGGPPSGVLVKHTFSSKVSVLTRRKHRLFENRLGEVPLSDFTVTLHLQCNLTECGFTLVARHAVTTLQAQRGGS